MTLDKESSSFWRFPGSRTHGRFLGGMVRGGSSGSYRVSRSLGTKSVGPKVQIRMRFAH